MKADKLEQIYIRYHKDMLRWAGAFFPDVSDREDAVSETFLRIMPHAPRVENVESAETARFCYIVLRNTCINMLKKKEWEIPTDFSEEVQQKKMDEEALRRHREEDKDYAALHRAVDRLPAETAEILWLTYKYGFSSREIGAQYGKSSAAVHQILSRARKQLKETLQGEEDEKN